MQGLLVQIQLQTASEIRPKWDNAEGYKHPSEVFNKTLLHFSIQTLTADCQIVYLSEYLPHFRIHKLYHSIKAV